MPTTSLNGVEPKRQRFWITLTDDEAERFRAYVEKIHESTGVTLPLSRVVKELALTGLQSKS